MLYHCVCETERAILTVVTENIWLQDFVAQITLVNTFFVPYEILCDYYVFHTKNPVLLPKFCYPVQFHKYKNNEFF